MENFTTKVLANLVVIKVENFTMKILANSALIYVENIKTKVLANSVLIIIIIITLFQDDNIFGTNASLTYGPPIQRHACVR